MHDVLVYIEPSSATDGGAARLLSWARPLAQATGGSLVGLTTDSGVSGLEGADVVLEVSHPALSPYLPEAHLAALTAAIRERNPDLVVLAYTTAGLDLAASSAAATDRSFIGYCNELSIDGSEGQSVSGIYGGQLLASTRVSLPAVVTVNSTALHDEPVPPGRGEHVQLAPPAELDNLKTTFIESITPSDEGVDLTKAERIVCVGRGIGGEDNIPIAEELAEALGAELAASRPVIDSGWLPKVRQIGKSGARVTPKLYLSLGVSGAPEHVEGMQGAELIIAVNKDPGAAIFNIAHYGVVADLFDIADELTSAVS